jgi:hypothetical protein
VADLDDVIACLRDEETRISELMRVAYLDRTSAEHRERIRALIVAVEHAKADVRDACDALVEIEAVCHRLTPGIYEQRVDETAASWYPRLVEMAIGLRRSVLVMIAADLRPHTETDIALGSVVSDVRSVIAERDAAIARAEKAERWIAENDHWRVRSEIHDRDRLVWQARAEQAEALAEHRGDQMQMMHAEIARLRLAPETVADARLLLDHMHSRGHEDCRACGVLADLDRAYPENDDG